MTHESRIDAAGVENSKGAPIPASPVDLVVYSPAYSRYALGLLCLVYVVNFIDRQILAILLPSIKEDLSLTDFELGLLSGTAFGLFYAAFGLPLARLADRSSRKGVIAICVAVWSGMTALCGTASGFVSLLIYRIGVGVGEAGSGPPSLSILSDYYPPEKRATAFGIFSLGVPIGIMLGFLAGGWLDENLGWRTTFIVVGLPGIAVSLLVSLTLREPPRGNSEGFQSGSGAAPSIAEVIRFLWALRSFRHVALGSAYYAFAGYSIANWAPSFLARSHDMQISDIGTALALIFGIGGGAGIYLGGVFADRFAMRDPRAYVWVPALAQLLSFPFAFVIYTTSSTALALVMFAIPTFLGNMFQAPSFAVTQSLATPKMRTTSAAFLFFIISGVGLGLGNALTGALSDALEPSYGTDSLRYAMLAASMFVALSAFHYYRAGHTLVADLEVTRLASQREAAGN
jgi:MFS family permease